MNASEIEKKLIELTVSKSNFETKRNYLSLSNAVDDIDTIINNYRNGYSSDETGKLKCYKGYQMERDMTNRLSILFQEGIVFNEPVTIGTLSEGHPDFKIFYNGKWIPGDCKSVLMDEWLPVNGKVSKKIYYQMQAYMTAMFSETSIVVFESRQSGLIRAVELPINTKLSIDIRMKFLRAEEIIIKCFCPMMEDIIKSLWTLSLFGAMFLSHLAYNVKALAK